MNQIEIQQEIYFEHQLEDRLCGLHCLNTLLQGPYVNVAQLVQIANQLDQQQAELMQQKKLKYSTNVDDDGNFSIQVIIKLLKQKNLSIIQFGNTQQFKKCDLSKSEAFICNLYYHWFTVRKINNEWYILDSLKQPNTITQIYLQIYLINIMQQGYHLFKIQGNLQKKPKVFKDLNKNQKLYSSSQILAKTLDKNLNKDYYDRKIIENKNKEFQEIISYSYFTPYYNKNIKQQYLYKQKCKKEFNQQRKNKNGIFFYFYFNTHKSEYCFHYNSIVKNLYDFCIAFLNDKEFYYPIKFYLQLKNQKIKLLDLTHPLLQYQNNNQIEIIYFI